MGHLELWNSIPSRDGDIEAQRWERPAQGHTRSCQQIRSAEVLPIAHCPKMPNDAGLGSLVWSFLEYLRLILGSPIPAELSI